MPEPTSVRVVIEGRVQGVGFRAWTRSRALALGLDGWVRNRADGGVEALLAGPAARVGAMVEECRSGPPYAHIDRLEVSADAAPPGPGFHILPGR